MPRYGSGPQPVHGRAHLAADAGATHFGLDTATPAEHLTAMYRRWGFRKVETIQFPGKTYPSTVMLLDLTT